MRIEAVRVATRLRLHGKRDIPPSVDEILGQAEKLNNYYRTGETGAEAEKET